MRWMKRLVAGVLAAGMALALLTACGSSKNNSVAPPVPITPPKTEAPNETITGPQCGRQVSDISNTVCWNIRYGRAEICGDKWQ